MTRTYRRSEASPVSGTRRAPTRPARSRYSVTGAGAIASGMANSLWQTGEPEDGDIALPPRPIVGPEDRGRDEHGVGRVEPGGHVGGDDAVAHGGASGHPGA